jgi:UPF0176 protein
MKYSVLLFYKYVKVDNPEALMDRERAVCEVLGIKGRIIVAKEGVNANIEGTPESIDKYVEHLKGDKRFRDAHLKFSEGDGKAFPRLSVKVREGLVGHRFPEHVSPLKRTGKYVQPHELKKMYEENSDDFIILDMRNDYEVNVGHFDKTLNLDLKASRDLAKPEVLDKIRIHAGDGKKLITICTGGVKCEKMSSFLLDQGIENVYQLHGGIQTYMKMYPGKDVKGALFTYDDRKVIHFGGDREIIGKCYQCGGKTENYENCAHEVCHQLLLVCDKCKHANDDSKFYCSVDCKHAAAAVDNQPVLG